jgi:hypothetical protein
MRYRKNRNWILLLLEGKARTQLKNSMKGRELKSQMIKLESYKILSK